MGMKVNDVQRSGSVFTWPDAQSAGMNHRQPALSSSRVMRGIYAADPTDLCLRIEGTLLIGGEKAAICGVSALQLAGVDIPSRMARDTRVWIQVPHNQHWPCRNEVRLVRPRTPAPVTTLRRFPCVQLPHCWLQLAPECTIDELVELADAMTRRQHPVTTLRHLEAVVRSSPGAKGISSARIALGLACPNTDSIPETDLRLLLVRAGLPCPVVNLPIMDDCDRVLYLIDLAYEKTKTAIEYDGAGHVADRRQMENDAARRRYLEDHGWRLITVTSFDLVTNPVGIINSVRRALTRPMS